MNNKNLKKIRGYKFYIPIAFLFTWYPVAASYSPGAGERQIHKARQLESLINQLKRESEQLTQRTGALVLKADAIYEQNRLISGLQDSASTGLDESEKLKKRHEIKRNLQNLRLKLLQIDDTIIKVSSHFKGLFISTNELINQSQNIKQRNTDLLKNLPDLSPQSDEPGHIDKR